MNRTNPDRRPSRPSRTIARTLLPIATVVLTACASSPPRPALAVDSAVPPSVHDLGPFLDAEAAKLVEPTGRWFGRKPKVVGLVVGVLQDGDRAFYGYGTTDHETGSTPDGHTVFEIGSITKTFVGALLADAARRGEVALDDPAVDHLPADVAKQARRDPPVTLLDLATHTSGLPRLPANLDPSDLDDPFADFDEADLWEYVGKRGLKRDSSPEYAYSNVGMGLLGHLLVRAASSRPASWEALATERIFDPLGMPDTRVTWSAERLARHASPYENHGRRSLRWSMDVLVGAGGVHSTANDMLTWAEANFDRDGGGLWASLRESHRPRHRISEIAEVALAWTIVHPEDLGGEMLYVHNGGTSGYHSILMVLPQSRTAVVVLANTDHPPVEELGRLVLQRLKGVTS